MKKHGIMRDPDFVSGLNNALNEATLSAWIIDPEDASVAFTLDESLNWDFSLDTASYPTITVVLNDVGRIAASLRQGFDLSAPVASFQLESLNSIMRGLWPRHIFGSDFLDADFEGAAWKERLSLDLLLSPENQDHTFWIYNFNSEWVFDLIIWFDQLTVLDADGDEVNLEQLIAGGIKWAAALHEGHPSTARAGIVPLPPGFLDQNPRP